MEHLPTRGDLTDPEVDHGSPNWAESASSGNAAQGRRVMLRGVVELLSVALAQENTVNDDAPHRRLHLRLRSGQRALSTDAAATYPAVVHSSLGSQVVNCTAGLHTGNDAGGEPSNSDGTTVWRYTRSLRTAAAPRHVSSPVHADVQQERSVQHTIRFDSQASRGRLVHVESTGAAVFEVRHQGDRLAAVPCQACAVGSRATEAH